MSEGTERIEEREGPKAGRSLGRAGFAAATQNTFVARAAWLWLYPWRAFPDGAARGNVRAVINEWQLNAVGELEKGLSHSNGGSGEELSLGEPKL